MKNKKIKLFVNRLVESKQTRNIRRENRQTSIKTNKMIQANDNSKQVTSPFSI